MSTVETDRIIDKVYDPEAGEGCLECTPRPDGNFDLVTYQFRGERWHDLTLYALTRDELLTIAARLQSIALKVEVPQNLQKYLAD